MIEGEANIISANERVKTLGQENRQLETDVNKQHFREVELQSEYKKLKDQEQRIGTFQLRQEELQNLLAKDQPEKLGEKVNTLVKKLKFIRQCKESELTEVKIKEKAKREAL